MTIPHVERYLSVERDGFVAVLEPAASGFAVFGQVGYWMGEGMGVLIERQRRKVFVSHGHTVDATPDLLAEYERFRRELEALLQRAS